MRRAVIRGITGPEGSYLAELLLSKRYEVHGIIRRASTFNTSRIDHIYQETNHPGTKLFLHHGDLAAPNGFGASSTTLRRTSSITSPHRAT